MAQLVIIYHNNIITQLGSAQGLSPSAIHICISNAKNMFPIRSMRAVFVLHIHITKRITRIQGEDRGILVLIVGGVIVVTRFCTSNSNQILFSIV